MPMPNRRAALVTAASGLLALGACHRTPDTVRVGFIGGLTGTVAELGVQGRNGALLATEQLNAEQSPTRYELLVEDDRQSDVVARGALERLAARRAAFVVGPMTSSVAVALLPIAQRLNLVLISPTATSDDLSGKPDHFFRVAADASAGARQLAQLLLRRGVRRVALLRDARNASYTTSFGQSLAGVLQAGGATITADLDYGRQEIDFTALAEQLMAGRPQFVALVAGVGDSALMGQQLRRIDPQVGLAVTPWAANPRLLQLGSSVIDGCLALQALDLDSPLPAYVAFRSRYRERFGEPPTTPAVQAYEATMVGALAYREVDGQRTLRQVLSQAGRRWPGLYSDIVFDANGDTQRPLHLAEVRAGRFVALQP